MFRKSREQNYQPSHPTSTNKKCKFSKAEDNAYNIIIPASYPDQFPYLSFSMIYILHLSYLWSSKDHVEQILIYPRAVSNGFSMKCRLVLMVERRRLLPTIKMSTRARGKQKETDWGVMELGLILHCVKGSVYGLVGRKYVICETLHFSTAQVSDQISGKMTRGPCYSISL